MSSGRALDALLVLLGWRLGLGQRPGPGLQEGEGLWLLARRHRVHSLLAGDVARASEEVAREQLRTLVLVQHLIRIQRLLETAEIPLLALKGPALAQQLYGDPGRRFSVDLDFLVLPGDHERALRVLQQAGYALKAPAMHVLSPRQRQRILSRTHHWILMAQGPPPVSVELHLRLVDPRWRVREDTQGVFQRAREVLVAGVPVRVMGPEDLIHYLALHGTKHAWNRLLWLADLGRALALEAPTLDWEALIQRARQWRSLRMLILGLYLAHQVFHAPVPEPVRRRFFRDPWVQRLAREIQRRWTAERVIPPGWLSRTRYEAQVQGGDLWLLSWAWLLAEEVFSPTLQDFLWISLPEAAFFLYPLLRPWRFLRQRLPQWTLCRIREAP